MRPPQDDLLTGEAVVVTLPVAGPAVRTASGLIDVVVELVLLVLLLIVFGMVGSDLDEALGTAVILLLVVGTLVGLPVLQETLTGRTLGKRVTGLRTVRADGGSADFRRIATRHLVGFVEIWLLSGMPALVTALLTDPTRRLGDIAASTYVVRDRIRLALPASPAMPPHLATWARQADLRIPDDVAVLLRSSLAQGGRFTDEAGQRVHAALAERVGEFVSPPPPPGSSARSVLDAVLAERTRRETARLENQERRRARLFDRS